jgi:hypothetical protein
MEAVLAANPNDIYIREATITALADAGEPERGRILLETWPEKMHNALYWRLRGRWELEYDHYPNQAVQAFHTALADLPQDWQTWYRLARALHILHRTQESYQATVMVSRIREVLDPLFLSRQLDAAFDHLSDPNALRTLGTLCDRATLRELADAWRTEAEKLERQSPDVNRARSSPGQSHSN